MISINNEQQAFAKEQLNKLNHDEYTSLVDYFEKSCDKYREKTAFSCLGSDIKYADLERYSRQFSAYLTDVLGLGKGDRVAIQLPNCNQYPIAVWGVLRAGLVLVNSNPLYTEREITHQLKDSGAKAIVVLDELAPQIEKIASHTDIKSIITTTILFNTDLAVEVNNDDFGCLDLSSALKLGSERTFIKQVQKMDDLAALQYTGGTTGPSKGAMLTHGNLFASSVQMQAGIDEEAGNQEIAIAPMPLYHIYGFSWNLVSCCLTGVQSVLIPNPRDVDGLIQTMKHYPFTTFTGVNTLFAAMMQHPEFDEIDFSYLGGTVSGGAALVSSIADEWERRTGAKIYEGYALSETSAALAGNTPDNLRLGTVGKVMPAMQIKVVDPQGCELGADTEGELWVRGPQVTIGYWNQPEASAEAIDPQGWFKTGDVAVIEADGFIRIVDRLKDMILVSGFNVYPNEIEDVVSSHEAIAECAVIGVPDERSGEAVKVFAVLLDKSLTKDSLIDFCRKHLTGYKVPKQIEFVSALPKSNVGKILRRALR